MDPEYPHPVTHASMTLIGISHILCFFKCMFSKDQYDYKEFIISRGRGICML